MEQVPQRAQHNEIDERSVQQLGVQGIALTHGVPFIGACGIQTDEPRYAGQQQEAKNAVFAGANALHIGISERSEQEHDVRGHNGHQQIKHDQGRVIEISPLRHRMAHQWTYVCGVVMCGAAVRCRGEVGAVKECRRNVTFGNGGERSRGPAPARPYFGHCHGRGACCLRLCCCASVLRHDTEFFLHRSPKTARNIHSLAQPSTNAIPPPIAKSAQKVNPL